MPNKKLDFLDLQKETFEDIVIGHKFFVSDGGRKTFKCSFCGGVGVKFYELTRDDGRKFLVGETCVGKAGVKLTKKQKELTKPEAEKVAKKVQPVPKVRPKSVVSTASSGKERPKISKDALDEFMESLK